MEKEFVRFDQALALKKLKFDEDCFAGYDTFGDLWIGYNSTDGIEYNPSYYNKAPLKQQVFRWFRQKHDLLGYIDSDTMEHGIEYSYHINILKRGDTWFKLYIDTYEEAENACIDKLIELAKQQDK